MNRRRAVTVGAGAVAAAAGFGLAWWQRRGADGPEQAVWALDFDAPNGAPVSMAAMRGRPLLLNFWATWCPPCVKELPLLDAFHRQQAAAGWQVVGLAVDQPTPVREFLAKQGVGFPVGLAGLGGVELSQTLGNASGALPFTVVFDKRGMLIDRKLGVLGEADLAGWVNRVSG